MRPAPDPRREVLARDLPRLPGDDLYAELAAAVRWEDVGRGRRGAVLTRPDATGAVPLVRTTTRYGTPAQRFRPVHERLARRVRAAAHLPADFDNALAERYTDAYATMGAHSDQAQDLAEGSYIAVFSCYENPDAPAGRKLLFEPKDTAGEPFELPLPHHGVVAFPLTANRLLRHRIVLDKRAGTEDNPWLGITFRTSRTRLRYVPGGPLLPDGTRLVLADEDQRQELYALRRRENRETSFTYPPLPHTLSESDLLPPA
ncbi:hypothetical protein [Streptomyces termitum]|uniref:hypothetical protein n=1 Tax=Streptomyces termitum TaxID=67368 RepID=UPI0033AB8023